MSTKYPFLQINVYRNSLIPLEEYLDKYLWTDSYEKLVNRISKITGKTEGVINLDCREPILHEKHKFWNVNRKLVFVDKNVDFMFGRLGELDMSIVRILDIKESRFKNVNIMGLTLPWYKLEPRKPRFGKKRVKKKSGDLTNPSPVSEVDPVTE
jgi:hypothetical protein